MGISPNMGFLPERKFKKTQKKIFWEKLGVWGVLKNHSPTFVNYAQKGYFPKPFWGVFTGERKNPKNQKMIFWENFWGFWAGVKNLGFLKKFFKNKKGFGFFSGFFPEKIQKTKKFLGKLIFGAPGKNFLGTLFLKNSRTPPKKMEKKKKIFWAY